MAMPANGQSLFTIEQIELIRRLRNSGISKEQMVQAFECLERLDHELGPIYNIPVTQVFSQSMFPVFGCTAAAPGIKLPMCSQKREQQIRPMPQKRPANDNVMPEAMDITNGPPHDDTSKLVTQPTPKIPTMPVLPVTTAMDLPNDSEELKEFLSQGPVTCCEEIRAFVIKHNIKQQQIATLAGISQSYVSRYLKGDYYDVSERSRLAVHKWYIAYRNDPGAIGPSYNAALLSGAQPMKQPFIRSPADLAAMAASDFMNSPRRERFVFRPNHLEILDRAFQEDSYPSHERREAIAKECNAVTEAIVCRPLTDKERVTGQILSNWFANKRKDMKKIAREEGFDISQVPFRSRGRPSRAYCDITAIPMTTAQEQVLMNSPPNHSNDSSNGQIMPVTGVELDDTTTATSTHSTEPSNGLDSPVSQDEQNLSLSVEIAAVNQAILALTGQQPIDVKTENGGDHNLPPASS